MYNLIEQISRIYNKEKSIGFAIFAINTSINEEFF